MIHPEVREDNRLAEEAQREFLRAHPFRDPEGWHQDLAAIEWRHGYIMGRLSRRPLDAESAPLTMDAGTP